MRSFWQIFSLEWRRLVRTRTALFMIAAVVTWMMIAPAVVKGDGTAAGLRTTGLFYSLGVAATIVCVSLLAWAVGSLAKEREAKRLQLALVRPASPFVFAYARIAAGVLMGAIALAVAFGFEASRNDPRARCRHLLRPVLPTPEAEAEALYPYYMNDPETPEAAKKAPKKAVLKILVQRARDRYQTVATNETAYWTFAIPAALAEAPRAVRFRLTNMYDLRDDARGDLVIDDFRGAVSNVTQAIATIPLFRSGAAIGEQGVLAFTNTGANALMLRPRRDIELLIDADGFAANLLRAYVEMLALVALIVSFGVFLGSALSRPVALFVAFAVLVLSEMTPSVLEQSPDELDQKGIEAVAMTLTRMAAAATRPLSSIAPLAALAEDECVEPREVAFFALTDLVFYPVLLALLAAAVLPRRAE